MIGEKLFELRKRNEMSQEEVAKILNVSRQAISKWERDESTPDLEKVKLLTNIYGITVDELLDDAFDVLEYNPPKRGMFSFIDEKTLSLLINGLTIISILSSLWILFSSMQFISLLKLGVQPETQLSGLLSSFKVNAEMILYAMMFLNFMTLLGTLIIYDLTKTKSINKIVKYFVFFFGLGLILFGQTLFGIAYLFISLQLSEEVVSINYKRLIERSVIVLIIYVFVAVLFLNLTNVIMPMPDFNQIGGF